MPLFTAKSLEELMMDADGPVFVLKILQKFPHFVEPTRM